MNFFQDRKIRKKVKSENVEAPDNFSKIIDETLNGLEDVSVKASKIPMFRMSLKVAMAMVVLSLVILPNISKDISYAMQQVPIVGSLVKVVTIRNYFDKYGKSELDAEIPEIENTDGTSNEVYNTVNDEVNKFTQRIIDSYNEEKDADNYLSVKVESDVITNNEDWLTLRLEILEVRAGTNIQSKFYHIDKKKDKIMKLSDLFIDDSYKTCISDEIKRQMISRMENDENETYWVYDEIEEWNFKIIEDNQEFYFSEEGNIVIVFDKYEVAPGYMGAPEFEISKDVYKELLKEEYKRL
ncbi:MAG: DUF3298 domain-containing protein [Clostridia bacterium]|nr:DUF3298 domain-containing protein [Clostridia bacterium]MCI9275741.1 DUF3298 domain-containing protein [Clostridia bacterium]